MFKFCTSLSGLAAVLVFCVSAFATTMPAMDYFEQVFEGALVSVPVPKGWQAEYQATGDVVIIGDGVAKGFLMAIGPDQDPVVYLKDALQEMKTPELAPRVRALKLAGYDAAVLDNRDLVHEKYVAIKKSGALLILYGTSKSSAEELTPYLDVIAKKTRIFPAAHPAALVGRYRVLAEDQGARGVPLQIAALNEEHVLDASGTYADAGPLPRRALGSWVQRGNRLIVEEGDTFTNYHIQKSHQGLILTDQEGLVSHWIRQ